MPDEPQGESIPPEIQTLLVEQIHRASIAPAKAEELLEGEDLAEYLELKRKDAERMASIGRN